MQEIEKDGIVYLISGLLAGAGAAHAFLSRKGGVSPRPFDTLNFAVKVGDDPGNVKENRARAARALSLPVERIVTARQVHGRAVAVAEGQLDPCVVADAVVTRSGGVPVGVLTADCLPVLIYDPVRKAGAAVHAGWRGTVLGVAASAVASMAKSFGSDPTDMVAALGPRIGPCCYSVKADVLDEFFSAFGQRAEDFFVKDGLGGLRCDLAAANTYGLAGAGVDPARIDAGAPCTCCTEGLFFSYRKEVSMRAGGPGETGRLLSLIMV